MAAAAGSGGEFDAWDGGGIAGIGRVNGRRAVAILALRGRQLGSLGQARETHRQPGADGVTGQTGSVGLTAHGDEQGIGERGRVGRENTGS